jgi:hypothetical protein
MLGGLETLYAEDAKGKKGNRTDLGQNLGQGEFGRFAENPDRFLFDHF